MCLKLLLWSDTMKTQMREREDVLLAVPASSKHGIKDQKRARADIRGHPGGSWIWERWGWEMECRGEEDPRTERWVQWDWNKLCDELRASQAGVCDQIASCRASSTSRAEPCSQLLITVKPNCQQIVLKLACKVLCALLASNCPEADNLLLLSTILLSQVQTFMQVI